MVMIWLVKASFEKLRLICHMVIQSLLLPSLYWSFCLASSLVDNHLSSMLNDSFPSADWIMVCFHHQVALKLLVTLSVFLLKFLSIQPHLISAFSPIHSSLSSPTICCFCCTVKSAAWIWALLWRCGTKGWSGTPWWAPYGSPCAAYGSPMRYMASPTPLLFFLS